MKRMLCAIAATCLMAGAALTGCSKDKADAAKAGSENAAPNAAEPAPTFTLAVSEYPSWSAFLAAEASDLIDGDKGYMGTIEKAHNVDIELKLTDYDTCLTMYGNGRADAVAITNMDALIPASDLPSVVIMPTSTSKGADALLVPKSITDVKQLKGKKIYMLAKSVSEYVFRRNLEKLGENPADYEVVNMDPGAAATAMQQKKPGYEAIMVWNPFVIDVLENRPDVHVLFDSTSIPGEVIDSIVASSAALKRPGGDRFAEAIVHAFYALNKELDAAATHDRTLLAIGSKFSNITDPKKMEKIVQMTRFYGSSTKGLAVFNDPSLEPVMKTVGRVYGEFGVIERPVKTGVGSSNAGGFQLRFDPQYMQHVAAKHGL